MKKFIKENWFKIAIALLLFLLPFLFLLPVVETETIGYSYLEKVKSFSVFASKNISGIMFLCLAYYLTYHWIYYYNYNHKNFKKYKRENSDNDKKFITQRCTEDGNKEGRHYVYLVNKHDKTYQWLEDDYTIKKLGYGYASRTENLFSKDNYKIESRIKIYNIIFDIKKILKLKNDVK